MNLTYNLVYTPSLDDGYRADEKDINWLCSDRKIHIRLRDYNKPEVIVGFINKLTYLVTYLVNSGCTASLESMRENPDKYLSTFCENDESFLHLVDFIKSSLHDSRYSGIKVTKVYRKKKVNKPNSFGIISDGAMPVEDGYKLGSIKQSQLVVIARVEYSNPDDKVGESISEDLGKIVKSVNKGMTSRVGNMFFQEYGLDEDRADRVERLDSVGNFINDDYQEMK